MTTRRQILAQAAMAAPLLLFPTAACNAKAHKPRGAFAEAIAAIEARHGGQIGAAVYDYQSKRWHSHRADERFAMCSTHKYVTVAALLARVDRGQESLDRQIAIRQEDIQSYAPAAKERIGGTMSLAELCKASITVSDNTAANLLFAAVGGPAKVTEFIRAQGDRVTSFNRIEPDLNVVEPGDLRDTTTPLAMARLMMKLTLGKALSESSRGQLNQWLVANTTGGRRLRGGMPADWIVGDKTGSGGKNTHDVAVVWPKDRKPMIVTAYYNNGNGETSAARGDVLMEVGRAVASL
jgi:beta-lactamase class A